MSLLNYDTVFVSLLNYDTVFSSRNGAIAVEISSAAADVRGRAAASSALSLARHTLSKKLMNADAGGHCIGSITCLCRILDCAFAIS